MKDFEGEEYCATLLKRGTRDLVLERLFERVARGEDGSASGSGELEPFEDDIVAFRLLNGCDAIERPLCFRRADVARGMCTQMRARC